MDNFDEPGRADSSADPYDDDRILGLPATDLDQRVANWTLRSSHRERLLSVGVAYYFEVSAHQSPRFAAEEAGAFC
jgi:hypothetical protein